jgi:Fur family ferric uptake transcriptional regulator
MSSDEILNQAREIFEVYLEQNGHRKTPERFAILHEIYTYYGHFDVETLFLRMQNSDCRVSRATLYNTMELLIDCNLVRKHQFGDNIAQYEKCHRVGQHDHVIIADSGEVLEFCDPRIQQIKSTIEGLFDVKIQHHSLYFYGTKNKKEEL